MLQDHIELKLPTLVWVVGAESEVGPYVPAFGLTDIPVPPIVTLWVGETACPL